MATRTGEAFRTVMLVTSRKVYRIMYLTAGLTYNLILFSVFKNEMSEALYKVTCKTRPVMCGI